MRSAAIMTVAGMTVMAQASSARAQASPASPRVLRVLVSDRASLRSGLAEHSTIAQAETTQPLLVLPPKPLPIAKPSVCGAAKAQAPDSPISRALALLGDAAPTERTVVVHTVRPPFVRSVATAWTDGVTIFINDQSEPYQHACKDAIALAGAIAHESYHLGHGPDEAPAYAEQLHVMRRLGASRHDLDVVERGLGAVKLANQPTTTRMKR